MWKNKQQASFADALTPKHKALEEFDDILTLIDWPMVETALNTLRSNSSRGPSSYQPLMMFKALLLQAWHNLSDPQLEKQLARDLLFRKFVGLGVTDPTPDHSSLWRFRNLLQKEGLLDAIFSIINQQLAKNSLIVKEGEISIIDASVIQAQRNRPKKGVDGENTQDPEASYSVKAGSDGKLKTTYGFKAHVNVDEDGYVKKTAFTTGKTHDSQCFDELLTDAEEAVYADSAYASTKTSETLEAKKVKNCILARAYRNTPLTAAQKLANKIHSSIRYTVEQVFGVLKLHYGMGRARYLGLARNEARFLLQCMSYNLKKGSIMHKEMMSLQEESA